MRYRTTLEQGLTSKQLFYELCHDLVEQYHDKPSGYKGMSKLELQYFVCRNRITELIKRLKRSDDEFRWLSSVGYRVEKDKMQEYRYVNLKPGSDSSSESNRLRDEAVARQEKYWKTYRKTTENVMRAACLSEEERAPPLREAEMRRRRFTNWKAEGRENGNLTKDGKGIKK